MTQAKEFEYTYSADRAKEIEAIRKKYEDPQTDKFEQLKNLDKNAEKRGMITSMCLGIAGTLILGIGMSLTMVGPSVLFVLGIIVGIIGIGVLTLAYPLYKKIVKEDREKIKAQIFELTKELQ